MTDSIQMSEANRRFILHWGEMGTRWGINRTVAQVHALLFLSPRPLNAEEIAYTLRVARSNVSTSLRELEGWGIVRTVHEFGDRRAYFESLKDVWEMYRIILDERKRRELDPTLAMLRACLAETSPAGPGDQDSRRRLEELVEFFQSMDAIYQEVRHMSIEELRRFVRVKGRVRKLLSVVNP